MKPLLTFLFFILASAAAAELANINPKAGETLYFERTYSKDHLNANPKQVVERIVIELFHEGGDSTPYFYIRVLKVGEKRPVYSAGGVFSDEDDSGKKIRFALDGEAGEGVVETHDGYILLKLRDSDFITLSTRDQRYGQGFDDEKFVEFSAKDPDHKTFKLLPSSKAKSAF